MLNFKNIQSIVQSLPRQGNKPFYILSFTLFFSISFLEKKSSAQTNLLLNPSFEDTIACPFSNGQVNLVKHWISPTMGTSDALNICGIASQTGVPFNFIGYQFARTGNGYCGFFCYDALGTDYREYIEGELSSPLIANRKYCVEFYLSLSDSSRYAIKNIGLYFSSNQITTINYNHIPLIPQVNSNYLGFITDTSKWVKVSGNFVAQGGESYITIGNFEDSISTQSIDFNPSVSVFNDGGIASYYYIDDVKITNCDEITNVFTPNNDGINDIFFIPDLEIGESYKIFDRWGVKVFEDKYNSGWDGRTISGIKCTDGVYYYISESQNGDVKKGFIQLIR